MSSGEPATAEEQLEQFPLQEELRVYCSIHPSNQEALPELQHLFGESTVKTALEVDESFFGRDVFWSNHLPEIAKRLNLSFEDTWREALSWGLVSGEDTKEYSRRLVASREKGEMRGWEILGNRLRQAARNRLFSEKFPQADAEVIKRIDSEARIAVDLIEDALVHFQDERTYSGMENRVDYQALEMRATTHGDVVQIVRVPFRIEGGRISFPGDYLLESDKKLLFIV